jgi:hypothetical protein
MMMKLSRIFIGFVAFLMMALVSDKVLAQTMKEILNSYEMPITYLGIDFSQAKLIGDPGANPTDIKARLYTAINLVIVNEPKKYDLAAAFKKKNISNDLSFAEERNSKSDADKIKSNNITDDSRFTLASIDNMVKAYDFKGKKGIGLLLIMESMNKSIEKGAMYVAFIDMATKKVLFTERMTGKAGGFGFRNYWVKPVHEVLDEIEGSKYKEWLNKFK